MRLIEGRCAGCGRLMFKFQVGTVGVVEIKCWASKCKQLNTFQVDSSYVLGLTS
jgi:phage FluMu protein Com